MNNQPLVSVCVITYQHKKYISKCLDGILNQNLDFDYEIILGEDDSQDGTREVCKDYAAKYSEKIKLFLRNRKAKESTAFLPGKYNFVQCLKSASGKYIALCDGDDYWTNLDKLQNQIDFLEKHSDYILVGHNAWLSFNDRETTKKVRHYKGEYIDVDTRQFICQNPFVNSMTLFRNIGFDNIMEFIAQFTSGDKTLFTYLSFFGKCRFYMEPKGFYRQHFSSESFSNRKKYGNFKADLENRIAHAQFWNNYANNRYEQEATEVLVKRARQITRMALRNYDFRDAIYYSQFINAKDLKKTKSKILVYILKTIGRIIKVKRRNTYHFEIR